MISISEVKIHEVSLVKDSVLYKFSPQDFLHYGAGTNGITIRSQVAFLRLGGELLFIARLNASVPFIPNATVARGEKANYLLDLLFG